MKFNFISTQTNHLILFILIIIAGLLFANLYFVLQSSKSSQNKLLSYQELQASEEQNVALSSYPELNIPLPASSLPHPNCVMALELGYPVSETYNPNTPYNMSFFIGNQSGFQDINGDGLADYIYVNTNYGGSNPQSIYMGCVYLNTGSGWERAHVCKADTIISGSSGQITQRIYKGDCAG